MNTTTRSWSLRVAVAAVLAAGAAACGGASAGADNPALEASTATASACPVPSTAPAAWPSAAPEKLPVFPGMTVDGVEHSDAKADVVRFSAPVSLHDAVVLLVRQLPKNGFRLAQGDSEAHEADAPFVGPNGAGGRFKLEGVSACRIEGYLTIGTSGGADRN